MQELPRSLQNKRITPKGFASTFKRWEIYPQTSYNTYNKNELVRFMFQTDQFIDPYQSYLEIQVTMDPSKYNYGESHDTANALLLDGPSTSLINELVLYSNSKEIERIQEYDQLGILLDDIGSFPTNKATRQYAGQRYSQVYSNIDHSKHCGVQSIVGAKIGASGLTGSNVNITNNGQVGTSNTFHKFNKTCTSVVNQTSTSQYPVAFDENSQIISDYTSATYIRCFYANIFPFLYTTTPFAFCKTLVNNSQTSGGLNNFADFRTQIHFRNKWESACNNTITDILSDGQFGISSLQGYECAQSSIFNNWQNNNTPTNYASYTDNWQGGTPLPYNYSSSFTKSDFICPFIDYQRIQNGRFKTSVGRVGVQVNDPQMGQRITDYSVAITNNNLVSTRTFYVPILSGVIGQLIPAEEWRLIPGKALGQLMFEWRLNPNAFYNSNINTNMTSFFQAVQTATDTSSNPSINQWGLNWTISKFSMHFDLWSFDDYVTQQINQSLAGEGIIMTSQSFTMGPQYNIANTAQITNNWQINNGVPSLKTLWFWFLSQDYQKYDYCRKNFRLSQNLTSIQLKIGEDYIPTQPIQGKAGNIHAYDSDGGDYGDCTQFMAELDRVVGNFFHQQKPIGITPASFVLNERCYEPANIYHCLRGQTGWNEQRCVGKALYTLDTQSDPFDRTVLSGIDTTRKRPIELILKSDATNGITTNSLMVVMLHFDMLVVLRDGEVRTIGTG